MFDTHAIAHSLTDAHLTPEQADAITAAIRQAAEHDNSGIDVETLATKADVFARRTMRCITRSCERWKRSR